MSDNKIIVGISQGDINGIGLEVVLKTLLEPGITEVCTPVLFSHKKRFLITEKCWDLKNLVLIPFANSVRSTQKK